MTKPKKQKIEYYDFGSVVQYMIDQKIWSELFASDVSEYFTDTYNIENGKSFTISDWDLKHNNGEFSHLIPKDMQTAINDILKHFGEPDLGCTLKGVLTATFMEEW